MASRDAGLLFYSLMLPCAPLKNYIYGKGERVKKASEKTASRIKTAEVKDPTKDQMFQTMETDGKERERKRATGGEVVVPSVARAKQGKRSRKMEN